MTAYKVVNSGAIANQFNSFSASSAGGIAALTLIDNLASSLVIDLDAFVYSTFDGVSQADAIDLSGNGAWTVTVNGYVGSDSRAGIYFNNAPTTGKHSVTIGTEGSVAGAETGIFAFAPVNITNSGFLAGFDNAIFIDGDGDYTITNKATGFIASDSFAAIVISSTGKHIISNAGLIEGGNAIAIFSDETFVVGVEEVTNTATGTIDGDVLLGQLNDKLTNAGKIFGSIDMGSGNDVLSNSGTIDYEIGFLEMGAGNDSFTNTGTLLGSFPVSMGAGDDKFTGGAKSEGVVDESGVDKYMLGAGDDYFQAVDVGGGLATSWQGDDTVDGGAGIDTYDASLDSGSFVVINLDTVGHGGDAATGFWYGPNSTSNFAAKTADGFDIGIDIVTNFENVFTGAGNDIVFGNASANYIYGGQENGGNGDDLWGLAGNDTLVGGSGGNNGDFLFGGAGKDFLWGGEVGGAGDGDGDFFVFLNKADSLATVAGRDIIFDFEQGLDEIWLEFDADIVTAGFQFFTAADFIGLNPYSSGAGDRTQLRYVYAADQTIIQADLNGDRKTDFSIQLDGIYQLTAADFDL